mmetsp:Transcript_24230/g.58537  ORF Transcript_24230/g.58537 Transcript_24230/m.58537 type:complete len:147 (+) Transcript_24230:163-603(+)
MGDVTLSTNPARTQTSIAAAENAIIGRRHAFSSIFAIGAAAGATAFAPAIIANAAEDNQVLTDEEMAARVARKQELLRAKSAGGGGRPAGSATDIRSDVNPEAGVNLRSRSAIENAKIAMQKDKEMKNRDKAQKREDLCEMLGRGC